MSDWFDLADETLVRRHREQVQRLLHSPGLRAGEAREALNRALGTAIEALHHARKGIGRGEHELWALCPFHEDANVGSFSVNTRTGAFYCFVCGARGGTVALLKRFNLWDAELREALRGLDWEQLSYEVDRHWSERGAVNLTPLPGEVLTPTLRWRPLRYVRRGHPRHILDALKIGISPLHERITFPTWAADGQLVGIQSRAASARAWLRWKWLREELRDLAPPELLRHLNLGDLKPPRSGVFYNEHVTLPALASGRSTHVVLVEGMGAALRTIAAGFAVMATFGTQMGAGQRLKLCGALERAQVVTGRPARVVLAYDGDAAGRLAAIQAYGLLAGRADILFAPMPTGKDPEDLDPVTLRACLRQAAQLSSLESTHPSIFREFKDARLQPLRAASARRVGRGREYGWNLRTTYRPFDEDDNEDD